MAVGLQSSSDQQRPDDLLDAVCLAVTAALTHAMAASFAGRVRVNSISPGWTYTPKNKMDR